MRISILVSFIPVGVIAGVWYVILCDFSKLRQMVFYWYFLYPSPSHHPIILLGVYPSLYICHVYLIWISARTNEMLGFWRSIFRYCAYWKYWKYHIM